MDRAKFYTRSNDDGYKLPMFCVLNSPIEGYKATEKEKQKAKRLNLHKYFELFDDDGIKYLTGYYNEDNIYEFGDELDILDVFMHSWGCTEMKTRGKSGKMEIV